MKIGDEVFVHGYIDEIRQDVVIIRNEGGYFGTIKSELVSSPKPMWIPCSERLPDITDHHTSEPCIVYCDNWACGFAELEENIFGQVGWNCERDDEYHEAIGKVVAWMPLPEPWKGEDDEAKR